MNIIPTETRPLAPGANPAERIHRRFPTTSSRRDDAGTPLWASDPTAVPGYRLQSRLGRGGMADVFSAVPVAGGAPAAVKILRADGAVQSCRREFELANAVDRDVTAEPITYGRAAAGAYLVTSYLPGYRSGTAALGPATPVSDLWTFGAALAGTLAAVHRRGIVHCDVKPSNLLVRGPDVRLIDFGISRYTGEPGSEDGTVQCSRGWAAPEQLRNQPATSALDVFAWGCVLAIVSTGVHPFASRNDLEWILRIESARPDLTDLPVGMEEVIRAALAHHPAARPHASELRAWCHQQAQRTRQPASGPAGQLHKRRWTRR